LAESIRRIIVPSRLLDNEKQKFRTRPSPLHLVKDLYSYKKGFFEFRSPGPVLLVVTVETPARRRTP
jgi:hypothetical protein